MTPIVLVHGAWHGAWCWHKVAARLRTSGFPVLAVDLPGHGRHGLDHWPVLGEYIQSVAGAVSAIGEPVLLVGHSMGGMVISGVCEALPGLVKRAVYLCAALPRNGMSASEELAGDAESILAGFIDAAPDGQSFSVRSEGLPYAFYADCSADDVMLAELSLTPQSVSPLVEKAALGAAFASVPRLYVVCTQDQAIGPAKQQTMAMHYSDTPIVSLDTSHSPFFSAPDVLAELIANAAS